MAFKNLMYLLFTSLLILMNNKGISSELESNIIRNIDDNISVNSEQMELLPQLQENNAYNDENNIQNIELNIQDAKVKNNDSLCNSFTTVIQGVLLIPMTVYGSIVSNIVVNNNENISSTNNEMIRIRSKSPELVGMSCNETITSFMKCIKIIGTKIINISTNAIGGAKSYIVRKICG